MKVEVEVEELPGDQEVLQVGGGDATAAVVVEIAEML